MFSGFLTVSGAGDMAPLTPVLFKGELYNIIIIINMMQLITVCSVVRIISVTETLSTSTYLAIRVMYLITKCFSVYNTQPLS